MRGGGRMIRFLTNFQILAFIFMLGFVANFGFTRSMIALSEIFQKP